jgi:hypothetical protein
MHASQCGGLLLRQPFEDGACLRRVRKVVHGRAETLAGTEDVRFRKRHFAATALREQVATEERARTPISTLFVSTSLPVSSIMLLQSTRYRNKARYSGDVRADGNRG